MEVFGKVDILDKFRRGNYTSIIEHFTTRKPSSADEYLILALSYYHVRKVNKALQILKELLWKYPNHINALYNAAIISHELGMWLRVREYVRKLMDLKVNNWQINAMFADLKVFEGFYETALQYYDKALPDTSAGKEVIKRKIYETKKVLEEARKKRKLAVICGYGYDKFVIDLIPRLRENFWVREYIVYPASQEEIKKQIFKAIEWADIIWFEWLDNVAVMRSKHPKLLEKPAVVRLHSYEVFEEFPHQVNWRNINKLVLVAPHIKEILKRRVPDVEMQIDIEIVYNGVDLSHAAFTPRKPGPEIAWVGNISHKKNPSLMLQIMGKLVRLDKSYRLHVAGAFVDLRYRVYIEHMVKELGLENNVIFYDWVDDMDEWWKDKNYLLSTSVHEGHPVSVLEAMARGIKPVIHNFYGARSMYRDEWLFNDIEEAIEIIVSGKYNSSEYRDYVLQKGWTSDVQIERIRSILIGLVESYEQTRNMATSRQDDGRISLNDINSVDSILKKKLEIGDEEGYIRLLEKFIADSALPLELKMDYYTFALYRSLKDYRRHSYISDKIPRYFEKVGMELLGSHSRVQKQRNGKIKVAILLNGFDYFQIIFRYFYNLVSKSKNEMFEYHFVSLLPDHMFNNSAYAKYLLSDSRIKYHIPKSAGLRDRIRELVDMLSVINPTVLIVNSFYTVPINMLLYPFLRKLVPVIGFWPTQDFEEYYLDKVDFIVIEKSDDFGKRIVGNKTTVCEHRHAVETDLIDDPLDPRKVHELPEDSKVLITIGRSIKYENRVFWDVILKLLNEVKNDMDLRVLLVGPQYEGYFKKVVPAEYVYSRRIIFHGPDLAGRRFLKLSDFFINSFPLGGGNSFREAYYADLPIITPVACCKKSGDIGCRAFNLVSIFYEDALDTFPLYNDGHVDFESIYKFAYEIVTSENVRNLLMSKRKIGKDELTFEKAIVDFEAFLKHFM